MYFRKFSLCAVFVLSGCQLTEDERQQIEQASDNLEKAVLKPKIDFPAENRELSDKVTVLVDVDESVEYESVTLKVEGRDIGQLESPPYEFNWDPYYWSQEGEAPVPVTLSVRAITADDNLLRSDVRNVLIAPAVRDAIRFTAPTEHQNLQNTDFVSVAWTPRDGAVHYEYRFNDEEPVSTTNPEATVNLTQLGPQQLWARAIDALGNAGAWSSVHSFNLVAPNTPVLDAPQVISTESGWEAVLNWSGAVTGSEVQIATDSEFLSLVDSHETEDLTLSQPLAAGVYYARVRTVNQWGHLSEWSAVQEFSVGLFAQAIDFSSYGWNTADRPVDFVVSEQDVVIAAGASNVRDGSSDDFYVTKISLDGNIKWGKSYWNYMATPRSIAKTTTGYILTGGAMPWGNTGIIALDELGNRQWHKIYKYQEDALAKTRTYEYLYDAVEVSQDNYVLIGGTSHCQVVVSGGYTYYTCPNNDTESKIIHLARSDNSPDAIELETKYALTHPSTGTYDDLTKLLLTETGLYAAGSYTATSANADASDDSFTPSASESGAFLLQLDRFDGHILSERVGGGLANSSLSGLLEMSDGDILIGYDNYYAGAATEFAGNALSNASVIDGSLKYAKYVSTSEDGGFVMVGQDRSNDRAVMVHYDGNNQKVGSRQYIADCYRDLRVKAAKRHPIYGAVLLGTAKNGPAWDDTETVVFNLTDDLQYICPPQ